MWIKIDDRTSGSESVMTAWMARRSPLGLHYLAQLHAGAQETDGRVPAVMAEQWVPAAAERERFVSVLLESELWVPGRNGGWQIAGFLEDNPSSVELRERRTNEAKRKRLERNESLRHHVRVRDRESCRYCATPAQAFDLVDPDGEVEIGNVVVCCQRCKRQKGSMTVEQSGLGLLPEPHAQPRLSDMSARTSNGSSHGVTRNPTRPDPTRPEGVVQR